MCTIKLVYRQKQQQVETIKKKTTKIDLFLLFPYSVRSHISFIAIIQIYKCDRRAYIDMASL
jgi:hypothetical protein